MNLVTFGFGLLLIGIGLVILVIRLRDRSLADAITALKRSDGENAQAITHFVTRLVVPTVTPIAIGISFLVVGWMGRSLAPFSWFGW